MLHPFDPLVQSRANPLGGAPNTPTYGQQKLHFPASRAPRPLPESAGNMAAPEEHDEVPSASLQPAGEEEEAKTFKDLVRVVDVGSFLYCYCHWVDGYSCSGGDLTPDAPCPEFLELGACTRATCTSGLGRCEACVALGLCFALCAGSTSVPECVRPVGNMMWFWSKLPRG